MADLFLQISVPLDGAIEDKNRDLAWFTEDTLLDELATETLRSIDGMNFGRKAHAVLAQFWPTAAESKGASAELIVQTKLMNTMPKIRAHPRRREDWLGELARDSPRRHRTTET